MGVDREKLRRLAEAEFWRLMRERGALTPDEVALAGEETHDHYEEYKAAFIEGYEASEAERDQLRGEAERLRAELSGCEGAALGKAAARVDKLFGQNQQLRGENERLRGLVHYFLAWIDVGFLVAENYDIPVFKENVDEARRALSEASS